MYFIFQFKIEIVKMCLGFWQLLTSNEQNQRKLETFHLNAILEENLIFTITYLFDNIKVAKKKLNAVRFIISIYVSLFNIGLF